MSDYSTFECYGGLTKISNRMIFGNFKVNSGKINAHLLGSGSGSEFKQFNGEVHIDQYITNYHENYREYIIEGKVSTESFINASSLYGGTFEETHNITEEELEEKIDFGRC
jgi:hypothetical protein